MIPATISAMIGLRHALDRALEALEPLGPVLEAWAGTAPAEAPGAAAGPPRPSVAANGARAPEQPAGRPQEASCPACGTSFARVGRQIFCSPRCRVRAGDRRRRAEHRREAAAEPVPDLLERPLRVPEHERSSDLAALEPPPLPWEEVRH